MPDVDRIILALRLGIVSDNDCEEDSTFLIDDDEMEGVVVEFSGEEFTTYTDDDLLQLALSIANETIDQVFGSLLDARTQIRSALEEVETIEMFQNQEPNWEV